MTRRATAGLLAGGLLLALGAPATAAATYAPQVEISIPTAGGPSSPAAMVSTVTQRDGEDATRSVEARLPGTFGFNSAFSLPGCSPADERAGACPDSSRIGRLHAVSPFGEAHGTLHLTEDFRLWGRLDAYGGLVRMPFGGVMEVHPGQVVVVRFDGLPDLPVRRLSLALDGGDRTPLALPRACGEHTISLRLVSQKGEERTSGHPIVVDGCPEIPEVVSARLDHRRVRTGSGTVLRWKVADAGGTRVDLQMLRRNRWVPGGSRTIAAVPRRQALKIGPRWKNRRLARGRYRVVVTPLGPATSAATRRPCRCGSADEPGGRRSDGASRLLPVLVAQRALEHLAGGRARQLAEDHLLGGLDRPELLLARGDDLSRRRARRVRASARPRR